MKYRLLKINCYLDLALSKKKIPSWPAWRLECGKLGDDMLAETSSSPGVGLRLWDWWTRCDVRSRLSLAVGALRPQSQGLSCDAPWPAASGSSFSPTSLETMLQFCSAINCCLSFYKWLDFSGPQLFILQISILLNERIRINQDIFYLESMTIHGEASGHF